MVTKSEFPSIDDAFAAAEAELEDDEAVELPVNEDPSVEEEETPVEDVDEEAESDDDEEQSDIEDTEKEAPSKLSELLKEETEEPEAPPSLEYNDDMVVDVPDFGQMTLKELREGNLRQKDYTQKTQELSEQRKSLEDAETLWSLMQEDAVGTIARLAVNAGLLDESTLEQLPTGKPAPVVKNTEPEPNIEELVARKVEEVLGSNPEIGRLKQDAQVQKIMSEFDRIEKAYNVSLDEDDRVAIAQRAVANKEGLELTYLKAQRQLDELTANKQRIEKSATKQRTVRAPRVDMTGEKPKSIEEAAEWALAELG